jgi:peptide/nickel transport system permease protein
MNALASAPTFAVALFLLIVLYKQLGLFPPGARLSDGVNPAGPTGLYVLDGIIQLDFQKSLDALWHLVIPCICLAIVPAVAVARVLHGSLDSVMREDFVRTARSKGLTGRGVVLNHGLRNASGPALSMAGLQFGALLTGVVIIEQMLSWPGLGRYASQAIEVADFPAITAVVLILGVAYVLVNFIVDLLQLAADPRLRARELAKS